MWHLVRPLWLVTWNSAASNDRRCVNYRRACERLADRRGGLRQLARICVCGSVRFRPEQICAVTDSVSEQQRSVRSIPITKYQVSTINAVQDRLTRTFVKRCSSSGRSGIGWRIMTVPRPSAFATTSLISTPSTLSTTWSMMTMSLHWSVTHCYNTAHLTRLLTSARQQDENLH